MTIRTAVLVAAITSLYAIGLYSLHSWALMPY